MTSPGPRVDRLWPQPAADLSLDEEFSRIELPVAAGRPVVGVNMVTSIDGRAQRDGTAEGLSGRVDRRLMQLYRTAFDAVAAGAGTLRADDFYAGLAPDLAELRARAGRPAQPMALLIGGTDALPLDRRWFGGGTADQRRVTIVGSGSPYASEPLPGVETWVAPTPRPDPPWILARLAESGIGSLLLEGGPHLNAAFLAAGLIDELYWTVGARIIGTSALSMIAPIGAEDAGVDLPREGTLVSVHRDGDELFLRYRFAPEPVE